MPTPLSLAGGVPVVAPASDGDVRVFDAVLVRCDTWPVPVVSRRAVEHLRAAHPHTALCHTDAATPRAISVTIATIG